MLNYIWAGLIIISLVFALWTDMSELWAESAAAAVQADGRSGEPPTTVRFRKVNELTEAAISSAEKAVTIALSLIGVLALWLGLMRIAEKAGLIAVFVKIVQPILRPLFPQVPKDHPALGMIALNLTANVLGLGNAATPMGIKAMEELQELNPSDDTATDPMVMLLAMNTASVQLVPPATVVAILGVSANNVIIPIIIVTSLSLIVAVTTTKLLGRLPRFRNTDPLLNAEPGENETVR